MIKIICSFLGHKWKYNFKSQPNKRICSLCKERKGLDFKTYQWTESFEDVRSDIELIKKWVK